MKSIAIAAFISFCRAGIYDTARTKILESDGFHLIRFWNNNVLENIGGVLEVIYNALDG
ncbi:MAG: DUF559 domain-containing protein [Gammaproteobacteria bacterium]|nr:DUF559 domain-containing protein [Gammaproteobacteria bacterium]